MFYSEKFKTIRISLFILNKVMEETTEANYVANIFLFEETSGDIMGLNNKMYDNQIPGESIKGKDIKVGYYSVKIDNFINVLVETIANKLQFKLHRIGFDDIDDMEMMMDETEEIDFIEHFYGQSNETANLTPILASNFHIFFRMPKTEFSSLYFVRVFNFNVWYAIAGIILISCILIVVFKCVQKKINIDYLDTIYYTLGIADVCDYDRMNIALRVMCLSLSVYMFLVMAAFSTFLTCELAAKDINVPFHNLVEFRLQNEYGFCISEYFEWQLGNMGYSQEINGDNCPPTYPPVPISETLDTICKYDKSIFFLPDISVYNSLSSINRRYPPCNLYKFTDDFFKLYNTIITTTSFKYKRQISLVITKLRTSGCLLHMERTLIGDSKMLFNQQTDDELISIEFDHVLLIFIVYFIILISSMVVFICEWTVFKLKFSVWTKSILAI